MTTNAKIGELLQQSKHYDADERYMATSDLATLFSRTDGFLDASLQVPIRNALLRLLTDSSTDVQAIAVRCLSVCVEKFHTEQVADIADKLARLILDKDKLASRDIYTIGLKTAIASLREDDGEVICDKLATHLIAGLTSTSPTDEGLVLVCLEILRELLLRFGDELQSSHSAVVDVVYPLVLSQESTEAVRKRASLALGSLSRSLSDELFDDLMKRLLDTINATDLEREVLYTGIQTIGVISRSAGIRVGKYLSLIMPQLAKFCDRANEEPDQRHVDLWENCLQAYEAVITRCPAEVTAYVDSLVSTCVDMIDYDPNFGGATDSASDSEDEAGDWGDGSDSDEYHFEDDTGDDGEDDSWKVRRAAARTLRAFIIARSDILRQYYLRLLEALVGRLGERDETVLLEVLSTIEALLRESIVSQDTSATSVGSTQSELPASLHIPKLIRTRSAHETLLSQLNSVVGACIKLLSRDQAAVKTSALGVVRQLVFVCRGGTELEPHLAQLVPAICSEVRNRDVTVRTDSLEVLRLIVTVQRAEAITPFVADICSFSCEFVDEEYTKIRCEALRLLTVLVCKVPADTMRDAAQGGIEPIYSTVYGVLDISDLPQDIKEAAINAMASVVAIHGDVLADKLPTCLPVLASRLENEVTRLAALRAVAKIAESSLDLDLSPILNASVDTLCKFLRKQSQALKHETVNTLRALVSRAGPTIPIASLQSLVSEVVRFVDDVDMHLSHLVLRLLAGAVRAQPSAIASVMAERVLPSLLDFVGSPVLQGDALSSLVHLFQTLLTAEAEAFKYPVLLESLVSCCTPGQPKQSSAALAGCIAAISRRAGEQEVGGAIDRFLKITENETGSPPHMKQLALRVLGEIGSATDLSTHAHADDVVFSAFSDDSDEVRTAAAYALGNISVGNLDVYLPHLHELVAKHPEHHYYLLHSFKELIAFYGEADRRTVLQPHVDSILELLLHHAESTDEAVRSMTAECLGRLAIVDPSAIVPRMDELVGSPSAHMRGVVIGALRFAVAPVHTKADALESSAVLLHDRLPHFLALLSDEDLTVRRMALVTVTSLIHEHVVLLDARVIKDTILPVVYDTLQLKMERTVDYGPFKQTVDDALPLRKASFMCLDTLLGVAPHRLHMSEFIGHIKAGFVDHDDIQIITYEIFYHLSQHHGNTLLEVLDELPPLIMKGIKAQLKAAKKGSEPEKAKDVLRIGVRALRAMNSVSGIEQCPKFSTFYLRVKKTALLVQLLQEMEAADA